MYIWAASSFANRRRRLKRMLEGNASLKRLAGWKKTFPFHKISHFNTCMSKRDNVSRCLSFLVLRLTCASLFRNKHQTNHIFSVQPRNEIRGCAEKRNQTWRCRHVVISEPSWPADRWSSLADLPALSQLVIPFSFLFSKSGKLSTFSANRASDRSVGLLLPNMTPIVFFTLSNQQ